MSKEKTALSPRKLRFRFSLLRLFIIMTTCCVFAAWWFFPRPVEIVALIYAQNMGDSLAQLDSEAELKPVPSDEIEKQRRRLVDFAKSELVVRAALRNPPVYDAVKSLAPTTDDLAAWFADRIVLDFPSGGEIMRWSLTVDQSDIRNGCLLLDGVIAAYIAEWQTAERVRFLREMDRLRIYKSTLTDRIERLLETSSTARVSDGEAQVMRKEAERLSEEAAVVGVRIQAAEGTRRGGSMQVLQPAIARDQ